MFVDVAHRSPVSNELLISSFLFLPLSYSFIKNYTPAVYSLYQSDNDVYNSKYSELLNRPTP